MKLSLISSFGLKLTNEEIVFKLAFPLYGTRRSRIVDFKPSEKISENIII